MSIRAAIIAVASTFSVIGCSTEVVDDLPGAGTTRQAMTSGAEGAESGDGTVSDDPVKDASTFRTKEEEFEDCHVTCRLVTFHPGSVCADICVCMVWGGKSYEACSPTSQVK